MEFTLPVRNRQSLSTKASLVSPRALADVFEHHATDLSDAYKQKLAALDFAPLRGFLRGFIDLVFEHNGRYFVVDYKSNHLGPHPADYAPSELVAPMEDHHYYLQYHLYVVALDRYLGARLKDYDYQRHFGGVYYLFLRGMAPSNPGGFGLFYDRPSAALTQALVTLFEGEGQTQ
jgi:exodeoxyribonuclease V beta subunit